MRRMPHSKNKSPARSYSGFSSMCLRCTYTGRLENVGRTNLVLRAIKLQTKTNINNGESVRFADIYARVSCEPHEKEVRAQHKRIEREKWTIINPSESVRGCVLISEIQIFKGGCPRILKNHR